MTPDPHKTKLERAEEFDIAAKIAHENGNPVFADELARKAHHLRMQEQQDLKEQKP